MIYLFGKQHAYYSYIDGDGYGGTSDDDSSDADSEDTSADEINDIEDGDDVDMLDVGTLDVEYEDEVKEGTGSEVEETIEKKGEVEKIKIISRDKKKIKKRSQKNLSQ
tara:strand:- start:294 stop:617 length:324 start_codon:yes stop_codon:yes gene_type:complete